MQSYSVLDNTKAASVNSAKVVNPLRSMSMTLCVKCSINKWLTFNRNGQSSWLVEWMNTSVLITGSLIGLYCLHVGHSSGLGFLLRPIFKRGQSRSLPGSRSVSRSVSARSLVSNNLLLCVATTVNHNRRNFNCIL